MKDEEAKNLVENTVVYDTDRCFYGRAVGIDEENKMLGIKVKNIVVKVPWEDIEVREGFLKNEEI